MYFLNINSQKEGPFSFEEVLKKDISRETLIWKEGLEDWTEAKNLSEFNKLFEKHPPEIKNNRSKKVANETKSFGSYMLKVFLFSVVLSLIYFGVKYSQYSNAGATLDKYDRGLYPGMDRQATRERRFKHSMQNEIPGVLITVVIVGAVGYLVYQGGKWVNENSD